MYICRPDVRPARLDPLEKFLEGVEEVLSGLAVEFGKEIQKHRELDLHVVWVFEHILNEKVQEVATEGFHREIILLLHDKKVFKFGTLYGFLHQGHYHIVSVEVISIVMVVVDHPVGQRELSLR